jgi:phosphatidylserine decarboxylase
VHVNRAPVDGVVEQVTYHPAAKNRSMALFGLQTLLFGRASPGVLGHVIENERNTISLRGDVSVCVVQIADAYVNKVRCSVRDGQHIRKGDRIGSIVMGSQVDILIAAMDGLKLEVKEGDRVKAGASVIATYDHLRQRGVESP